MKQIVSFIAIFTLLAMSCALAVGLPNPITERASLEEVNRLCGTALCHPAVMGVTDEVFQTIECEGYTLAQYNFRINGYAYCFRGAKNTSDDISGVYLNGANAFGEADFERLSYAQGEGMKLARWFIGDVQYTVCIEDPDAVMDSETFHLIAEEFRDYTQIDFDSDLMPSALPVGVYWDRVSQRAWMNVELGQEGQTQVTVHWADSAEAYTQWTMTLYAEEDGRLSYDDCAARFITVNEEGKETAAIVYDKQSGYFTLKDGVLYWDGAIDDSCKSCEFVPEEA